MTFYDILFIRHFYRIALNIKSPTTFLIVGFPLVILLSLSIWLHYHLYDNYNSQTFYQLSIASDYYQAYSSLYHPLHSNVLVLAGLFTTSEKKSMNLSGYSYLCWYILFYCFNSKHFFHWQLAVNKDVVRIMDNSV